MLTDTKIWSFHKHVDSLQMPYEAVALFVFGPMKTMCLTLL
jgi:hypothetical protein